MANSMRIAGPATGQGLEEGIAKPSTFGKNVLFS